MELCPQQPGGLARAVKLWSNPGDPEMLDAPDAIVQEYEIDGDSPRTIDLPAGSHSVRAVQYRVVDATPGQEPAGSIAFYWDGAPTPAVDAPLEFFFGQAFSPEPFQSLLMGATGSGYYNFIPMPYRSRATVKVAGARDRKGVLTLNLQPLASNAENFGYHLHAIYQERTPVEDGLSLKSQHDDPRAEDIISVSLPGDRGISSANRLWLEGDEKFDVEWPSTIHGTGNRKTISTAVGIRFRAAFEAERGPCPFMDSPFS
jgi:hypothetical protein